MIVAAGFEAQFTVLEPHEVELSLDVSLSCSQLHVGVSRSDRNRRQMALADGHFLPARPAWRVGKPGGFLCRRFTSALLGTSGSLSVHNVQAT
jgi:hypothetical protein